MVEIGEKSFTRRVSWVRYDVLEDYLGWNFCSVKRGRLEVEGVVSTWIDGLFDLFLVDFGPVEPDKSTMELGSGLFGASLADGVFESLAEWC